MLKEAKEEGLPVTGEVCPHHFALTEDDIVPGDTNYKMNPPLRSPEDKDWKEIDVETWKAMEELYLEGKIRAIGLSNFLPHHIESLLENCEIVPMLNQLEIHPGNMQEAAVRYCQEKGIFVQAYRPIGRGQLFEDVLLKELEVSIAMRSHLICSNLETRYVAFSCHRYKQLYQYFLEFVNYIAA